MDPTLLLLAAIACLAAGTLLCLLAAFTLVAFIWHDIQKPPPDVNVYGGPVEDERRNEARASAPELYVDPTDYLLPPMNRPEWHEAPVRDDLMVPTPDGKYLDLTGSIDQVPLDTNMDEPTVMPDGTVVLHGEIIHRPEGSQ